MTVAGLVIVMLVVGLGEVARIATVARWDLAVDQHLASGRITAIATLAKLLTYSATPEVTGIGSAILLPIVLAALGRRSDAVKALCVIGGALALALFTKNLIAEPRPPQSLWAIPADGGTSYPSGHTTVAAALIAALIVIMHTATTRTAVAIGGSAYTLAVAASRVYVANHYPLDVIGSLLAATAAAVIVTGLSTQQTIANQLSRLEPQPRPLGRHSAHRRR